MDLIIEGPLRGDELLNRMNGWFTADVYKAVEIFKQYGKLKVLDDVDLVIETKDSAQMEELSKALYEIFREEAWVEIIPRQKLA